METIIWFDSPSWTASRKQQGTTFAIGKLKNICFFEKYFCEWNLFSDKLCIFYLVLISIFNLFSLPKSIRLKIVVTMNIIMVIMVLLQCQQRGIVNHLKATEIFPQRRHQQLVGMQIQEDPQLEEHRAKGLIQGHYHTHTQCPQVLQCLNVVTKLG